MQESVLIDVLSIPSGRQTETLAALRAGLEAFRHIDGFVEAGVLTSRDGAKVAWYLSMRSAEDWESAAERAEICERLRALQSIGSSHTDAFDRIWVIAPPTERGPIEVSYGAF
jgi:hypothetical protein